MESFSNESDYLSTLESRSALPEGFRCATQGIRFSPRERTTSEPLRMNLSLLLLEEETPAFGAVFTRNRFPGAPVLIGRERLAQPGIRGVLVNNKIANVGTPRGREDAERLLGGLGELLHVPGESFFAASTGIIGWGLPVEEMSAALPSLTGAAVLGVDPAHGPRHHDHRRFSQGAPRRCGTGEHRRDREGRRG